MWVRRLDQSGGGQWKERKVGESILRSPYKKRFLARSGEGLFFLLLVSWHMLLSCPSVTGSIRGGGGGVCGKRLSECLRAGLWLDPFRSIEAKALLLQT